MGGRLGLSKLRTDLQAHLVKVIVNAVFATGLFTQDALQNPTADLASKMEQAADAAETKEMMATTTELRGKASTAESAAKQDAVGVDDSVKSDGQEAEAGEEADQKKDDDEDDAEESLDIDDEDD